MNAVKRDLDSRINSFTAPEEPINTPAEAADAARVVMRRAISAKLSAEIPQTQPINAELRRISKPAVSWIRSLEMSRVIRWEPMPSRAASLRKVRRS